MPKQAATRTKKTNRAEASRPAGARSAAPAITGQALSESALPIPAFGEVWAGQGGICAAYMLPRCGNPGYYLIAPNHAPSAIIQAEWGGFGHSEPGATDDYDGLANTRALVDSKHTHPAAERCAALSIDGHTDFYLAARFEMMLCRIYSPGLFEPGWFWSSTQSPANFAWAQYFANGDLYSHGKYNKFRAFPVRRLII